MGEEAVCARGVDPGGVRYGFLAALIRGEVARIRAADTRDDEFGRAQK